MVCTNIHWDVQEQWSGHSFFRGGKLSSPLQHLAHLVIISPLLANDAARRQVQIWDSDRPTAAAGITKASWLFDARADFSQSSNIWSSLVQITVPTVPVAYCAPRSRLIRPLKNPILMFMRLVNL